MIEREKVIKEAEEAIDILSKAEEPTFWMDFVRCALENALSMLKEQEAVVKPKSKVRHGANAQIQHFCGNCNAMLHGKPKYCSECGKRVLW